LGIFFHPSLFGWINPNLSVDIGRNRFEFILARISLIVMRSI